MIVGVGVERHFGALMEVLKVASYELCVVESLTCFELITHLEFATLIHPFYAFEFSHSGLQSHWMPYSL